MSVTTAEQTNPKLAGFLKPKPMKVTVYIVTCQAHPALVKQVQSLSVFLNFN